MYGSLYFSNVPILRVEIDSEIKKIGVIGSARVLMFGITAIWGAKKELPPGKNFKIVGWIFSLSPYMKSQTHSDHF